jgi:hypothetical protein
MTINQSSPPRRRPRAGLGFPFAGLGLTLLGAVMLVLTACGSATPPGGVATLNDPASSAAPDASPAASLDPEAAMKAFEDCMRDHGVDIQATIISKGEAGSDGGGPITNKVDSGTGTNGTKIDKDKFVAAQDACKSLLPQGGTNGPGGQIDPEFEQKLLDFAKCMRDHGIDMPDPEFSSTGGGGRVTIGGPDDPDAPRIDPESKAFQDAQAACGSILPDKFGTGAATGEVQQ